MAPPVVAERRCVIVPHPERGLGILSETRLATGIFMRIGALTAWARRRRHPLQVEAGRFVIFFTVESRIQSYVSFHAAGLQGVQARARERKVALRDEDVFF